MFIWFGRIISRVPSTLIFLSHINTARLYIHHEYKTLQKSSFHL